MKTLKAPDECISTSTQTRLEKKGFPGLKAVISLRLSPFSILLLPLLFFFSPLLPAAQRLHTSGTGALIDQGEQSKIEAEMGDGGSFCTLSGDPRERGGKGGQVYTK